MNPNPLCIFGHQINKEQLNGWYEYWKYKKESAACKSFYVIAKKEPLIPLIWFEASLNSFK
jgi:hypothetical protein